jgi:hypothetical protein
LGLIGFSAMQAIATWGRWEPIQALPMLRDGQVALVIDVPTVANIQNCNEFL